MKRRLMGMGLLAGVAAIVSACGGKSPSGSLPGGTRVDSIIVDKSDRKVYLIKDAKIIRSYPMHLGWAPYGQKTQYGDGRTPEGTYYIDRKNPNSAFYLSIGISYPNAQDIAQAQARGVDPGGDIFIHGGPRRPEDMNKQDWTAGCIAVTDAQIREIYSLVDIGTPVLIRI